MKHVAKITSLNLLNIQETAVTDVGLRELATLKNLRNEYFYETKVTDAGKAELRKALPNCKVQR